MKMSAGDAMLQTGLVMGAHALILHFLGHGDFWSAFQSHGHLLLCGSWQAGEPARMSCLPLWPCQCSSFMMQTLKWKQKELHYSSCCNNDPSASMHTAVLPCRHPVYHITESTTDSPSLHVQPFAERLQKQHLDCTIYFRSSVPFVVSVSRQCCCLPSQFVYENTFFRASSGYSHVLKTVWLLCSHGK